MLSTFSIVSAIGSALLLAQVGFDDLGIVADLIRGALGDDTAEIQHRDALADAHDQAHVMLDQQHSDVELIADAADGLGQLSGFRGVHTRGRLIQQQQLGAGGQRTHDLQTALCAIGQAAGLRTINKMGLDAALKQAAEKGYLNA